MPTRNGFIFAEWTEVKSTQLKGKRNKRKGQRLFFPLCEKCFENTVQCEYYPGLVAICDDCQMQEDVKKIRERLAKEMVS